MLQEYPKRNLHYTVQKKRFYKIKGDNMTKSFEEKLEELEKLVKQLESDNVPLKEAVELYTQANILLKECNTELNDTKATIQKISEDGVLEEF